MQCNVGEAYTTDGGVPEDGADAGGVEINSDDGLLRFDRKRKRKKASNQGCDSP